MKKKGEPGDVYTVWRCLVSFGEPLDGRTSKWKPHGEFLTREEAEECGKAWIADARTWFNGSLAFPHIDLKYKLQRRQVMNPTEWKDYMEHENGYS